MSAISVIASTLHKGMFLKMNGDDVSWYAIKSKATHFATKEQAQATIDKRKLSGIVVPA